MNGAVDLSFLAKSRVTGAARYARRASGPAEPIPRGPLGAPQRMSGFLLSSKLTSSYIIRSGAFTSGRMETT
jgi:hypothetical protein